MEYKEILVRTIICLQKISAEMTNNGADKEVLKNAMEVIEKIMEVEE